MILYGGRLSPFVRRVELWLAAQNRPVERRYVNVFDPDFGGVRSVNPIGRVPALVIESGENLCETAAIIDYLEDTAHPDARLLPPTGAERWRVQQTIALSHGIAEKAVAYFYETTKRPPNMRWATWQQRLALQITQGLEALEERAKTPQSPAAVIGMVCTYDLIAEKLPEVTASRFERLNSIAEAANADPAFARTHPSLA